MVLHSNLRSLIVFPCLQKFLRPPYDQTFVVTPRTRVTDKGLDYDVSYTLIFVREFTLTLHHKGHFPVKVSRSTFPSSRTPLDPLHSLRSFMCENPRRNDYGVLV